MMSDWIANQANRIAFVMVDANNLEVAGLGSGFTLSLSKNGGAFVASAGTKAEIGNGWYTYLATAPEANTLGPVAIKVTGAGAAQQNLEYVVLDRNAGAVNWTFTVTSSVGSVPIQGATVHVTIDLAGLNKIESGVTNALGKVVFFLQPGTYYFLAYAAGYSFPNPVTEVVS